MMLRADYIPHDRLFKDVLRPYVPEFLHTFAPDILRGRELKEVSLLDKEIISLHGLERRETDLIAKLVFHNGDEAFCLVHIEVQSQSEAEFPRRMFSYYAHLFSHYGDVAIYPIALFTYDGSEPSQTTTFEMTYPDGGALVRFTYRRIHLRSLDWRTYAEKPNPLLAALIAKMRYRADERPQVKAESLRIAASLGLDQSEFERIARFVDAYITLDDTEQTEYNRITREDWSVIEQETVTEYLSPWERKVRDQALEEGREEGREEGAQVLRDVITRQVKQKFGDFPTADQHLLIGLSIGTLQDLVVAVIEVNSYEAWRKQLDDCR